MGASTVGAARLVSALLGKLVSWRFCQENTRWAWLLMRE